MRKRRGRSEGSIYRRADGLWAASLRLGYSGARAVRKVVYGKSKQEVQTKLMLLQRESITATDIDSSRISVEDFANRWLRDYVRIQCRATTLQLYESLLRNHVLPYIGKAQLQRVSPAMLHSLYAQLEKDGASARMRQMVHGRLHKIFVTAKKWRILSQNPCEAVDPPRVPHRAIRYLDVVQAKKLLLTAARSPLAALYAVALGTGIRQGELLALHWNDVDFRTGTISIRHTLQDIGGRPVLQEPKTSKSKRMVVLPEFALKALREHRKLKMAAGGVGEWVFSDGAGGPLRKSNFIRRSFKPMLREAGLPDIRFHDLRHTAATLLLSQGTNPKVVQEMLGHSTVSMTLDTYSHVTPSLQRAAASAMNEMLAL